MYLEIFVADFAFFGEFCGISRKYLNFTGPRPCEISEALVNWTPTEKLSFVCTSVLNVVVSFFSSGNFYFSFVSTSLAYNIIPPKREKQKLPEIKT